MRACESTKGKGTGRLKAGKQYSRTSPAYLRYVAKCLDGGDHGPRADEMGMHVSVRSEPLGVNID